MGETRPGLQSPDHADLPRPRRHDAAAPRGRSRRCCRILGGVFGNPSSPHAFGRARPRGARRRPRAAGRAIGAEAREIVFTSGGTEAQQPRAQGRRVGRQGARPPDRDHRRRAPRRAATRFAISRSSGSRSCEVPVDRYGRVDPADVEPRDHRPHDPRRGRCSPTTRSARSSRSRRSPRSSAPTAACCSTSTPCRRPRGCDLDVDDARGATSSRSPATRPRARRASARCGSGAGRTSSPSSTAARRSATGARARRTSPAPSAWRAPSSCVPPSGTHGAARPRACATGSRAALLAIDGVELTGHPASGCPHILSVDRRAASTARRSPSGPRPRGHRGSTGSACTTGSTEPSHVLTRHGLPGRRGARLAAPVASAARRPTPRSTRPARSCPRSSARLLRRRAVPAAAARRPRGMSRILVAMSGGVDSSVAAALLHEQGHEVVGVWMRLHDVADTLSRVQPKSCCSPTRPTTRGASPRSSASRSTS